jgi:predicted ATPase
MQYIKAIRKYTEIEIKPITILMGENLSGKSSMLQALLLSIW